MNKEQQEAVESLDNTLLIAGAGSGKTFTILKKIDFLISEKIYKDMAKGYKAFIEKGYKGFSQVAKVLIGVFITLPITCTALNWVYPRFMELFFPKLAGVKKEGGNK